MWNWEPVKFKDGCVILSAAWIGQKPPELNLLFMNLWNFIWFQAMKYNKILFFSEAKQGFKKTLSVTMET